jgi:acyl-CoA synthetase (AMP-forming)/AMP-acid ligase II
MVPTAVSQHSEFILRGQKDLQHARPPPDGVLTLSDLFAHTVHQYPQRPALSCSSGGTLHTLSYFDLARRVGQVSDMLREEVGVKGMDLSPANVPPVVGIWFERSAELTIAVLAATTIGFTWLPFDPDAPVDRVKACLGDSNARFILCDNAHYDRASAIVKFVQPCQAIRFSDLAADRDASLQKSLSAARRHANSDDPAYMIYTSGSES